MAVLGRGSEGGASGSGGGGGTHATVVVAMRRRTRAVAGSVAHGRASRQVGRSGHGRARGRDRRHRLAGDGRLGRERVFRVDVGRRDVPLVAESGMVGIAGTPRLVVVRSGTHGAGTERRSGGCACTRMVVVMAMVLFDRGLAHGWMVAVADGIVGLGMVMVRSGAHGTGAERRTGGGAHPWVVVTMARPWMVIMMAVILLDRRLAHGRIAAVSEVIRIESLGVIHKTAMGRAVAFPSPSVDHVGVRRVHARLAAAPRAAKAGEASASAASAASAPTHRLLVGSRCVSASGVFAASAAPEQEAADAEAQEH